MWTGAVPLVPGRAGDGADGDGNAQRAAGRAQDTGDPPHRAQLRGHLQPSQHPHGGQEQEEHAWQGLTLVRISAQRKRFLRECVWQFLGGCLRGVTVYAEVSRVYFVSETAQVELKSGRV
jgi:hypothetical protein